MSHKTSETACTRCEAKIDACTGTTGAKVPVLDDISVCFYCQHVMQFNDDLSLRDASPEAVEDVMLEISRIQNAISHGKNVGDIGSENSHKGGNEDEE